MFCKNCGAPMNDNAAFCVTCGAAVGQGLSLIHILFQKLHRRFESLWQCFSEIDWRFENKFKYSRTFAVV